MNIPIPHLSDFASQRKWLACLIRGLFSLLFAFALLVWPQMTIAAMLFLSAVYVLLDGTLAIWTGLLSQQGDLMMFGFIAVLIGSYAFFPGAATGFFFLAFITGWALLRGLFEIHAAFKLRHTIQHEWWLVTSGTLSLMLSVLCITVAPSQVMGTLWVLIGYAAISGVIWIFLAFEFRRLQRLAIPFPISLSSQPPTRLPSFSFVKHKR